MCDAQGRPYPLPCAFHRTHHTSSSNSFRPNVGLGGPSRAALCAAAAQSDGLLVTPQPAQRACDYRLTPGSQPHRRFPGRSHLRDPACQRPLLRIARLYAWQISTPPIQPNPCSLDSLLVMQCAFLENPNSQLAPSATNPFYGPRLDSHREDRIHPICHMYAVGCHRPSAHRSTAYRGAV